MRKILAVALALSLVIALSACQAADVVGKVAVTSFDAVLNKIPDKITSDEANKGWVLTSPTGERFVWSKDFSQEGTPDIMLEFDARPFLDAGLDAAKLPKDMYIYDGGTNKLMIRSELGADKFTYSGEAKPLDSFKKIVEAHRDSIGYHASGDHYGVALGNDNKFEWAKDMGTNKKDIVFVLNPQPFIDAGVDPAKVKGWVFGKVEVMNEQGKTEKVDRFLKPFDLQ